MLVVAALLCPATLTAQVQGDPPWKSDRSRAAAKADTSVPIPPTVAVKSPVDFFRDLLAMNGVERRDALTNRSPESRKIIMAKLREYAALSPNERELRLQATELRWYLWPMMKTPATNRAAQVSGIPAAPRALVESRLKEWDELSSDVRKDLLENEATLKFFTEIHGLNSTQLQAMQERMTPAERQKLQEGIDRWNRLGDGQRRNLGERFNQFFELTDREQDRALNTLSTAERRQIETTLRSFGKLPADERAECIRSFEKFASLNLIQRQLFLKSAERWKVMTPNERQAWRELVNKVPSAVSPPPLPPEPPPLPLVRNAGNSVQPVATNGN